jgi:hypothetical protein
MANGNYNFFLGKCASNSHRPDQIRLLPKVSEHQKNLLGAQACLCFAVGTICPCFPSSYKIGHHFPPALEGYILSILSSIPKRLWQPICKNCSSGPGFQILTVDD